MNNINVSFNIHNFNDDCQIIGLAKCINVSTAEFRKYFTLGEYYPIVECYDQNYWMFSLLDNICDMYSPFDGTNTDVENLKKYIEVYIGRVEFEFITTGLEIFGQHVKLKDGYLVDLI